MFDLLKNDPELWRIFTREEEYVSGIRDHYDRFPHFMSSYREIFEPLVSKRLIEEGLRIDYEGDGPFAVCLSHDIDLLNRPLVNKGVLAGVGLMKRDFRSFFENAKTMRSKRLPFSNLDRIMDLEESYGAKSTFFFMALDKGEEDHNYDIEDVAQETGAVADRGWEIGLHGGHSAYDDFSKISSEKERLEKAIGERVRGYRNHYLRFKTPDTWEHLSKAGFDYDSTFGYADMVGFRNGMCHPFKPYNLRTDEFIDIIEVPLNIMDCTLGSTYMRLGPEMAWNTCKRLIDTVEKNNGVLSVLWHNTYMDGDNLKFYIKILDYCSDKGAWITGIGDLVDCCRDCLG